MDTHKTYTPIDCHFYDLLEVAAMRREYVDLVLQEENETRELRAFIDELRAENGVEYMYLHNGMKVRLDDIVQVDGKFNPSTDLETISCLCH